MKIYFLNKIETLWIDYNKIWIKIQSKYGYDYIKTKIMIDGWLNETTNWKGYTSCLRFDNLFTS